MSDPQGSGNALSLDLCRHGENSLRCLAVPPLLQDLRACPEFMSASAPPSSGPGADGGKEPRVCYAASAAAIGAAEILSFYAPPKSLNG